jgi:hypothetical protein
MNSEWKKKVEEFDEKVEQTREPGRNLRINYDALKKIGILYPLTT